MSWILEAQLPVHLARIDIRDVHVEENSAVFDSFVKCAEHYADLYAWTPLSEIPGVQNARQFFRAIGVDPTKRRPSSEALLSRAIKKKELYSVNTLVDVGNWCSLDFLLPTCVYDADKIQGDVRIRLGRVGESYLALNNSEIDFEGRCVLVDERGPFGSPMTDSLRTSVSRETKNAVLGIWTPEFFDVNELKKHADLFAARTREFCGGILQLIEIL